MPSINIRQLEKDLAHVEAEAEKFNKLAEHFRAVIAHYKEHGDDTDAPTVTKEMDDAMERILEMAGKPLHFKVIHARLEEQGIHVPGKDPARNTGAHLSLDRERFASKGQGMWGLVKWDKPQINGNHTSSHEEEQDNWIGITR